MPLDLNEMRAEFARFLHTDPKTRWRLDAALAHVLTVAYTRGLADGERRDHETLATPRFPQEPHNA